MVWAASAANEVIDEAGVVRSATQRKDNIKFSLQATNSNSERGDCVIA